MNLPALLLKPLQRWARDIQPTIGKQLSRRSAIAHAMPELKLFRRRWHTATGMQENSMAEVAVPSGGRREPLWLLHVSPHARRLSFAKAMTFALICMQMRCPFL
jgi:hypothetical protein